MIITSDLHLTDRPRDEYRFDFLKWLFTKYANGQEKDLVIPGDLTDSKDGHSSKLVNRIIDTLLNSPFERVWVLMGNHDYQDPDCPFFRFLGKHTVSNSETGQQLRFIYKPEQVTIGTLKTLMLPHDRDPSNEWKILSGLYDFAVIDLILCHQTFNGADAGKGITLQGGISSGYFSEYHGWEMPVISGDIHVPQKLGPITYVGCPYPIAFGDSFLPRILRVTTEEGRLAIKTIRVPSITKWSVDIDDVGDLDGYEFADGDQAKIRLHLPREEFSDWDMHKAEVMTYLSEAGVHLHSLELKEKKSVRKDKKVLQTPTKSVEQILEQYCTDMELSESVEEAGRLLLKAK